MFSLFTDGGSRGNPGESAIAAIIFEDSKLFDFEGKYNQKATNNNAEYKALELGISLAIKHDIKNLVCNLDSELVVKQLNKIYKVSDPEIKKMHTKILDLTREFDSISFKHVPREQNKFADRLVNIILDCR